MNTLEERHEAAQAIAAMRSGNKTKQTSQSRALEIDKMRDDKELEALESGEYQ